MFWGAVPACGALEVGEGTGQQPDCLCRVLWPCCVRLWALATEDEGAGNLVLGRRHSPNTGTRDCIYAKGTPRCIPEDIVLRLQARPDFPAVHPMPVLVGFDSSVAAPRKPINAAEGTYVASNHATIHLPTSSNQAHRREGHPRPGTPAAQAPAAATPAAVPVMHAARHQGAKTNHQSAFKLDWGAADGLKGLFAVTALAYHVFMLWAGFLDRAKGYEVSGRCNGSREGPACKYIEGLPPSPIWHVARTLNLFLLHLFVATCPPKPPFHSPFHTTTPTPSSLQLLSRWPLLPLKYAYIGPEFYFILTGVFAVRALLPAMTGTAAGSGLPGAAQGAKGGGGPGMFGIIRGFWG
jgi:hypothetical protein